MAVDSDFERPLSRDSQPLPSDHMFATLADKVRNRAAEVLNDESGLTHLQRSVLRELSWRSGAARILDLGLLSERVKSTPRKVRETIQTLREMYGISIGASHDSSVSGYYLIATQEEAHATIMPMRNGAIAQLRVVKAMTGSTTGEILNMVRKELDKEAR